MKERYDFSQGVRGKYLGKVEHRILHIPDPSTWKHPSVRALAEKGDPVDLIVEMARAIVLDALDSQTLTLPIDPFKLAERRSIPVVPRPDVRDARTVCGPDDTPVIEYNPNRPKTRVRFSICHELAHTLFPDCTQQVRNRLYHAETTPVSYELEMLCNLAAAEFLLPVGSIQEDLSAFRLSIATALQLRLKYEASVEAVLLRLAGLSSSQCAVFAAVADEREKSEPRYRLEYVKAVQNWDIGVTRGDLLPSDTAAKDCVAIGFTASSQEEWSSHRGKLSVEMVGVSPYPGRILPRVVGLAKPIGEDVREDSPIKVVRGDALRPRGEGEKIIAHVVNDQTPNWGAGFGRALQLKWPQAQRAFKEAFEQTHGSKLGQTFLSRVDDWVATFQMVAQRGYGASPKPRLRYGALRDCLQQLREAAIQRNASVHMPKIGSGEAGGSWALVSNLIAEELCTKGVSVTVYELPGQATPANLQGDLFSNSLQ
jgi:Zn-dependent peptidase ImmA (M78 family)/O-acetyl-ADP-ribose deacetylase (regulator of RNase III)